MKTKAAWILLLACVSVFAAESPRQFYSRVERHLRELKSLEIGYTATGLGFPDNGAEGRLIWVKPDHFYHEGPEWIHCESGDLQWRYLKNQNTVLLDVADDRSDWLPENMLLNLNSSLTPVSLDNVDGENTLTLNSGNNDVAGVVAMIFEGQDLHPSKIALTRPDGSKVIYKIGLWSEEVRVPDTLFVAPEVPRENVIDFRTARRNG